MDNGLIHIYCGDGKGKTTASIGLAVRAAGRGFRVLIVQFLKSTPTGEINILASIPQIKILRGDDSCTFTINMNEEKRAKCLLSHTEILNKAIALSMEGSVDLLVLDEIMAAYNNSLVDKAALLGFLRNKPSTLEVVMTGRNPASELIELSDYVSEIKKIKHPYDKGINARIGIEK